MTAPPCRRWRTTVPVVPDAPIGHFRLVIFGGRQGYLGNTRDLCAFRPVVKVSFKAQNGDSRKQSVRTKTTCGRGKKAGKKITGRTMELFLSMSGDDMENIRMELEKLISYTGEKEVITDEDFQTPATAARYDGLLAVVNAKFDTGIPPTADRYEVVLVDD